MKIKSFIASSTIAFTFSLSAISQAVAIELNTDGLLGTKKNDGKVTIEDPYIKDQENSPWTMSMESVTTESGREIDGRAAILSGAQTATGTYAPFFQDQTEVMKGNASSTVSVGCDGINLGGVIDGQLNQYGDMVEGFIQNAPSMAIMYLAYSQPTVKAVIDELNVVSQFGLDMTNMSCSGVRAMADKAAEEKVQATAEARCTAEAGYKDAECISDDGLGKNVAEIMRETKQKVSDRSQQYLGKLNSASGGLVTFSSNGNTGTSSGGATGNKSNENGVRAQSCDSVDPEGLRPMLLASSGLSCYDIENYSGLLPNYQIGEEGESGVIPRTTTVRRLVNDITSKHNEWLTEIVATPEADYPDSPAFKAIFNRTGIAITTEWHRILNRLEKNNPARALLLYRAMSQKTALKDVSLIVNRLEVAVLNGIQNMPDDQLLPDLRKKQFIHAIESLRTELNAVNDEVELDLARAKILLSN